METIEVGPVVPPVGLPVGAEPVNIHKERMTGTAICPYYDTNARQFYNTITTNLSVAIKG